MLDVDTPTTVDDPYALPKATFLEVKQSIVQAGGTPSDYYHGDMVSAACQVAARDFFKTFQ